jgi:putative FmdB family regulatory protein
MPTYEYECGKCRHRFEAFQSITAAPLRKCPACGGRIRRLLGTGAGVIFKGGGFYQTDYRSSSYRKAAKADSSSPSAPASTAPATPAPAPAAGPPSGGDAKKK